MASEMSMALKIFAGPDTTKKTYKEYREWKVCIMAAVGIKHKGGGTAGPTAKKTRNNYITTFVYGRTQLLRNYYKKVYGRTQFP